MQIYFGINTFYPLLVPFPPSTLHTVYTIDTVLTGVSVSLTAVGAKSRSLSWTGLVYFGSVAVYCLII